MKAVQHATSIPTFQIHSYLKFPKIWMTVLYCVFSLHRYCCGDYWCVGLGYSPWPWVNISGGAFVMLGFLLTDSVIATVLLLLWWSRKYPTRAGFAEKLFWSCEIKAVSSCGHVMFKSDFILPTPRPISHISVICTVITPGVGRLPEDVAFLLGRAVCDHLHLSILYLANLHCHRPIGLLLHVRHSGTFDLRWALAYLALCFFKNFAGLSHVLWASDSRLRYPPISRI